jgi:hypothetical protein
MQHSLLKPSVSQTSETGLAIIAKSLALSGEFTKIRHSQDGRSKVPRMMVRVSGTNPQANVADLIGNRRPRASPFGKQGYGLVTAVSARQQQDHGYLHSLISTLLLSSSLREISGDRDRDRDQSDIFQDQMGFQD